MNLFSFLLIISSVSSACFLHCFKGILSGNEAAIAPDRIGYPINVEYYEAQAEVSVTVDYVQPHPLDPEFLNYIIKQRAQISRTRLKNNVNFYDEEHSEIFVEKRRCLPRLDEGDESEDEEKVECNHPDIHGGDQEYSNRESLTTRIHWQIE